VRLAGQPTDPAVRADADIAQHHAVPREIGVVIRVLEDVLLKRGPLRRVDGQRDDMDRRVVEQGVLWCVAEPRDRNGRQPTGEEQAEGSDCHSCPTADQYTSAPTAALLE